MKSSFLLFRILFLSLTFNLLLQGPNGWQDHTITYNPLHYGLATASTGEERYMILLKCHQDAVKSGARISYQGIQEIDITIPKNAVPIPIPNEVDFCDVVIRVINTERDIFLFQSKQALNSVEVSGLSIDRGNYTSYPELVRGQYVLVIEDAKPWVENRSGYTYGAWRRDLIVVNNGYAVNTAIMNYNNPNSIPRVTYFKSGSSHVFKGLHFVRDKSSTAITYLLQIENSDNVIIEDIEINTPFVGTKYGDSAISITNVAGLTLEDVTINGTYSQSNRFGYGVSLNNIYDLKVRRMTSNANWGVFGNNNINTVLLEDCDINRFDVHCYGKDLKAIGCNFYKLYNQFSSMYGTVLFENCTFTEFTPILVESSYNAYTPFNLVFNNCIINMDKNHNFLMTLMDLPKEKNLRPELTDKNLPNVTLRDCVINVKQDVLRWYIFNTGNNETKEIMKNITEVNLRRLKVRGGNPKMSLFTREVKTAKRVRVRGGISLF